LTSPPAARTRDRQEESIATDPPGATAIVMLVAVVAAAYFGLFNHDFSVNGLRYADAVERGVELFHPNHLLPNALFRCIYVSAQSVGLTGIRAIWLMQAVTVCFGVVAAAGIARIAHWRKDAFAALLAGALYAFGFAAWNFAEEPDVYVLPAAAVSLSLAMLLPSATLSWRAVAALARRGEHDDGRTGQRGVVSHRLGHGKAVHLRHVGVEQDERVRAPRRDG